MTHDRNYLRMLSDYALWDYTQTQGKTELELVLAERLFDLTDAAVELDAAKGDIGELQTEIDALKAEVAELQAHIDATRGYAPDE
jgi:predicted  nucleic acid-binding Zn-ribbon protein